MKKLFLTAVFLIVCLVPAVAQSSERISEMIKTDEITFAQASYLIATYKGMVAEDADNNTAFLELVNSGIIKNRYETDDLLTLDNAAYLCAWTMDIKGGIFYSLFKSPRYAFKELQAKGVLPSDVDPIFTVSGREFLGIFNACADIAEEN